MNEEDVLTFQMILKELHPAGLSVNKFAEAINVGRSTLYKYMSNASVLSESTYIYILYQLKTKYPYILETCLKNINRPAPAPLRNICPVYTSDHNGFNGEVS